MSLKDTYEAVMFAAMGHRNLKTQERDGKLHITGAVSTEDEMTRFWAAIKTVPTWQQDVVANVRVQPKAAATPHPPAASGAARTYTVVAGDTLTKIAERYLGDAKQYSRILDANRDQLATSDKIRPGQVLRIPA